MLSFPFNVYFVAFVGACVGTGVTLPLWRVWCRRVDHVDDPGHRKIHYRPVALAGGLAVFTGLVLPLMFAVLALSVSHPGGAANAPTPYLSAALDPGTARLFAYGFEHRGLQLTALGAGALGMLLIGWFDDRHELRPAVKFGGQCLVALLVAAAGVRITLFIESPTFSLAVTVLWIVTVTNASNFVDNMNGLCAGLGFLGAWCFAWTGAIHGQFLVAAIGFLTAGALLGFLPYNFPTASAFLGDAGSHLVGYLLAILAILPHFYTAQNPERWAVLKPLLILGVILGDLVAVLWIRWRLGKPFYIGDTNHLSHRLVRHGLTPSHAVLVILLAAALLGAASFAL